MVAKYCGSAIIDKINSFNMSPKFIRDPVHDLIRIENKVILNLLDTSPMQRLRYIKQLPFASWVYPGADHSRLIHSLGVYHLTYRLLRRFQVESKPEGFIVLLASLLHDVGHGPFSHLFESVLKECEYEPKFRRKHEDWSVRIIKEHSELIDVLDEVDNDLKNYIADVISNTFEHDFLGQLVSSQFDADRMDYMLRDSYMTGVHYGKFDLNWVLRTVVDVEVENIGEDGKEDERVVKKLAIDSKRGISALEDYLVGIFNLYKHVYFHKVVLSAEGMVKKILLRAINLLKTGSDIGIECDVLGKIADNQEISLDEYLSLNDNIVMSWIHYWAKCDSDPILKRLCYDLIGRKLFKVYPTTNVSKIQCSTLVTSVKILLEENGLDSNYFFIEAEPSRRAYNDLFSARKNGKSVQEIYYTVDGEKGLPYTGIYSEGENLISDAIKKLRLNDHYIIVPHEIATDAQKLLEEAKSE